MQVLRNLINNAKKFSKPNTKIFVEAKLKKNMILFSVKDQGVGISIESQKRIFEPFFQAEQTMYREYSGTGLGLAICRGIVESQKGRIWVESEKGKGSTFFFTVPLKPVRDIEPIKLLLSEEENIDKMVEDIFKDILGPMGPQEFENFEKENKLTKENLFKYLHTLNKQKILEKENIREFKRRVLIIFGNKK
jgi:anti-sigma regulatory factor (Ser/Thr protein kinase)